MQKRKSGGPQDRLLARSIGKEPLVFSNGFCTLELIIYEINGSLVCSRKVTFDIETGTTETHNQKITADSADQVVKFFGRGDVAAVLYDKIEEPYKHQIEKVIGHEGNI